jgi:hypothetical protein
MEHIALSDGRKDSQNSLYSGQYDGALFGLVENIKRELDIYGLETEQVLLDVETEFSKNFLEFEYTVETLQWYEADDEFGLGKDPVSFKNSYSIDTEQKITESSISSLLEDNFDDSAIRVNGNVVRESLSRDYNAF